MTDQKQPPEERPFNIYDLVRLTAQTFAELQIDLSRALNTPVEIQDVNAEGVIEFFIADSAKDGGRVVGVAFGEDDNALTWSALIKDIVESLTEEDDDDDDDDDEDNDDDDDDDDDNEKEDE